MLVTEQQAGRMTCPTSQQKCQGTACMAFRWAYTSGGYAQSIANAAGEPVGYCGLAGVPQQTQTGRSRT